MGVVGSHQYPSMDSVIYGKPAAEALREEAERLGAKRVYLIVSRTLNTTTNEIEKIRKALGDRHAATFDGVPQHTTRDVVTQIARQASEEAALVVAIGGGSVVDAAKIVLMCMEHGNLRPEDVFANLVATTRGWLSAGTTAPMVALGGSGNVEFRVYSNQSALRLEGDDDNDLFIVRAFALAATVDFDWSGTVIPTKEGVTFTPDSRTYSNVTTDQTGQDYVCSSSILLTISGTVSIGGSGLAGVVMSELPNAPVTDGNGYYSDEVSFGWSGTVTPTLERHTFTPASWSYASVTSNQTTNYTAALMTYTISGAVTSGGVEAGGGGGGRMSIIGAHSFFGRV